MFSMPFVRNNQVLPHRYSELVELEFKFIQFAQTFQLLRDASCTKSEE